MMGRGEVRTTTSTWYIYITHACMFFCVSFVVLILDSLIDGIDAACTVMAGVYHHAPSARREGARDNNYLNKSLGYDR